MRIKTKIMAVVAIGLASIATPAMAQAPVQNLVFWVGGDSFGSGEGTDYKPGTVYDPQSSYIPGTFSTCKRTTRASGYELAKEFNAELRFPACAGSTVNEILRTGKFSEPPQVNSLDGSVDVAIITAGGINIGFGSILSKTLTGTLSATSPEYVNAVNVMNTSLPSELAALYTDMAARIGPDTQVLVQGYPYLPPKTGVIGDLCKPYLTSAERDRVIELEDKLNTTIRAAVAATGDNRFEFIDPTAPGSPFLVQDSDTIIVPLFGYNIPVGVIYGRDACSWNPKNGFNTLRFGIGNHLNLITTGAFHPNELGHEYYKALERAALN